MADPDFYAPDAAEVAAMSDRMNVERRSMERRLRTLEDEFLLMREQMTVHFKACEKRGVRLERLAWATGTAVISVFGLLLKAYFHIGM